MLSILVGVSSVHTLAYMAVRLQTVGLLAHVGLSVLCVCVGLGVCLFEYAHAFVCYLVSVCTSLRMYKRMCELVWMCARA